MFTFLVIVQIITCIALVIVVLLQQGKGAEIGAVFGSSEAIFGSAGPAPFLAKVTAVLATIFMCTSIALTYLSAHQNTGSIMQGIKQPNPISVPAPPPTPTTPSQKSSTTTTVPTKTVKPATTHQNTTNTLPQTQSTSTSQKNNKKANTIKSNAGVNPSTTNKTKKVTKTGHISSSKSSAINNINSTSSNK